MQCGQVHEIILSSYQRGEEGIHGVAWRTPFKSISVEWFHFSCNVVTFFGFLLSEKVVTFRPRSSAPLMPPDAHVRKGMGKTHLIGRMITQTHEHFVCTVQGGKVLYTITCRLRHRQCTVLRPCHSRPMVLSDGGLWVFFARRAEHFNVVFFFL